MRFVNVRELRIRPGEVWKRLRADGELVVTSRGKPVAVLADADEDTLEATLASLRQARARAAVTEIRRRAARLGLDKLTVETVNEEIGAYRASRKPKGRR